MKHIESIQPELAADELDRLLAYDDATATVALTRLLHDWTGCDIPQTSALPESEVEELVPLCVSILRRHWQTPLTCLGDGITPMSLADLFRQSIGDRVNGNEALGIPAANANIPAALTALRDRKISGIPQAPDGISLAQLLCGSDVAGTITELKDDNVGWTMTKALTNLPNLEKLELGCKEIIGALAALPTTLQSIEFPELVSVGGSGDWRPLFIYNNPNVEELVFPKAKAIYNGFTYDTATEGCFISTCSNLKKVTFQELEWYGADIYNSAASNGGAYCCLIHSCENLEEVYLPKFTGYRNWRLVRNTPNLRKLVLGVITTGVVSTTAGTAYPFDSCVNLVHLEIQGCVVSLDLRSWNPTTALAERLDEFLSNFKTYIAHRLTDKGSGLTLTLSPSVRDAIQQDPEIVSIITSKGWTISPAPSV